MSQTPPRRSGSSTLAKAMLGLLAVLWAALVLLAYYYTHKPIQPVQAGALAKLTVALIAWMGTLVGAHWLGGFLDRFIPGIPVGTRIPLRIGLGLGVLGTLVLALGAIRAYYIGVAWGLWLAGLLLGAGGLVRDLRTLRLRIPTDKFNWFLAGFVALVVGMAFLRALAPPTAWDSLVYHLTGPKLYIQAHGLTHDLDLPYLGFPAWGSMLFTWGMLLAGPSVAQLLHFTFMLLTLAFVADMARSFAPGRDLLSVAVLLAVPSLAMIAGWAYVEWMTMFAATAAFWCLSCGLFSVGRDRPGDPKQTGGNAALGGLHRMGAGAGGESAMLAGALAGLGFSAKYTLAGLVIGLALIVFLRRRSWRDLLAFGAAFALVTTPFLIKNWALTGNPVYPFFFPGRYWDADRQFWYSRPGTGLPVTQILLAPWEATIWGVEGGAVPGHASYGATIGPLLLILLPLSGLYLGGASERVRGVLSKMLILCAVVGVQWGAMLAFSSLLVQTRLLFVIFPFLSLMASLGLEGLRRTSSLQFRADFVMRALVLLSLSMTAIGGLLSFVASSPLPVILGVQNPADFLQDRLGGYYLAVTGVNDLPEASRVAFLWEPRSYFCSRTVICEPDALLDRWWHLRQQGLGPEAIAKGWRRAGISHVLLNWSGVRAVQAAAFDPFVASDWQALSQLVDRDLVEVGDWGGSYSLYRLK
jgi:hypothetical protein